MTSIKLKIDLSKAKEKINKTNAHVFLTPKSKHEGVKES